MSKTRQMVDKGRQQELALLCKRLGTVFQDLSLLHQALVHTSYANETKHETMVHNERLEFLGDAVLDLIISDYLFRKFPQLPEGELTKARAVLVCETTLARRAGELQVGEFLYLGRGEELSGGRQRISILADAFEAIIGAIYLDHGIPGVTDFVMKQLAQEIKLVERGNYLKDYKTLLQELVQRKADAKIQYQLVGEEGPDHGKIFHVEVWVNDRLAGHGSGRSKKEAEQHAAQEAFAALQPKESAHKSS